MAEWITYVLRYYISWCVCVSYVREQVHDGQVRCVEKRYVHLTEHKFMSIFYDSVTCNKYASMK